MSFYTSWMNSFKGKCKFDMNLFSLTREQRLAEYGEDAIEELRNMTCKERIDMYGQDFAEELNKCAVLEASRN